MCVFRNGQNAGAVFPPLAQTCTCLTIPTWWLIEQSAIKPIRTMVPARHGIHYIFIHATMGIQTSCVFDLYSYKSFIYLKFIYINPCNLTMAPFFVGEVPPKSWPWVSPAHRDARPTCQGDTAKDPAVQDWRSLPGVFSDRKAMGDWWIVSTETDWELPSGKRLQKTMENHHFQWVNPL